MLKRLIALLLTLLLVCSTALAAKPKATVNPSLPLQAAQELVDYLANHDGELPERYITKKDAQNLGWDSSRNYVSDVAPGCALGGTYFGNYEGLLPTAKGRRYYECDCYYTRGKRNAYRLVYSNDGLYFYSADHYATYTQLFPTPAEEDNRKK